MDTTKKHEANVEETMTYPGVAVNKADDDEVNACLEKQSVKELNNNPRNSDM